MRPGVVEPLLLVNCDPTILVMPFFHQLADGAAHELRQIPEDKPGVFSGEFDLT